MTVRQVVLMLVEDSDDDALLTERALREDKVAIKAFIRARHGQEALDLLRNGSERPDLILLDLYMPVMDGREFLEQLHESGFSDIPVIVFTSEEDPKRADELRQLGASAVVLKPMDLMQFRDAIKKLVDYWFAIVRFNDGDGGP